MAITFTYDESTNVVVVTEGTSGTPATFDDFVTADRAGTAELTPEDAPDACTTNMTLTYQIRPLASLALQITFTLAGTSAGGGDTLDVTGTDWDGNAQGPESIDVSGGEHTGDVDGDVVVYLVPVGFKDDLARFIQPEYPCVTGGLGELDEATSLILAKFSNVTIVAEIGEVACPIGLFEERHRGTLVAHRRFGLSGYGDSDHHQHHCRQRHGKHGPSQRSSPVG
jgi:hypothetical protein